jgi:hypothetical protein
MGLTPGTNLKTPFFATNRFSYYDGVFARLAWKGLLGTNTLTFYENP